MLSQLKAYWLFSKLHSAKTLARSTVIAAVAIVAGSSGCATGFREYVDNGFKVGPNYKRPAAAVSDEWIDYQNKQLVREPAQLANWWRVFNDPILDELVLTSYQQNLTLRQAAFRVIESRALLGVAVGNFWPQTQVANGGYTRQQMSRELGFVAGGGGGFPGGGGGVGMGRSFSIWNTGTQLAWELDFWGRFRRAIESADATLDASVEEYDDVLVILVSDVASAYIDVRTLQQRLEFARRNVISQEGSLGIAEERLKAGATSRLDVAEARSNLAQTAAIVPQLEIQLRQAHNRLCVLLGMPPRELESVLGTGPIPGPPAQVAVGVPADLIRRRPDVRRAERVLAAQSARIGIAEADLYPAFSITGSISVQAREFNNLFQSSAVAGNVGPSFNWNIFNYGRLRNNIAAEEARFQQFVAQYQSAVLNANEEAENAIVSYLQSQVRASAALEGATAAQESSNLVQLLYRGGNADFGRVFVAEGTLVQRQDELARTRGEIAQSLIDIYRSLGGGWELRLEAPPVIAALPTAPATAVDAGTPTPAVVPGTVDPVPPLPPGL